jgi:hypothetical protein
MSETKAGRAFPNLDWMLREFADNRTRRQRVWDSVRAFFSRWSTTHDCVPSHLRGARGLPDHQQEGRGAPQRDGGGWAGHDLRGAVEPERVAGASGVGRLTADEFVERVRERVLATRASVPVANEDSERGHCWRVGVAHGARVAYEMLRLIDQPLTGLRATGFAHGHQWNAHAICVLCREQAKDLLDSEGMYRACTSRRLAEAEPQRTDEGMRERPRCKCEQCSRHDAASPWISDKPGPCDCTECKAHDSCDICRGGRMDEGECCFECGNGVRTPGGALAISESDDQPTATEEAPMFHRFSECALRVLEYLRSAGEPEHTPLVMVSPIPPEDVLAAVNAICAAASALESGDQWTIEQGNALRRAAETLLLVRHREQFAARNLQDRMNAIGRRAAEHCAKLDAAQKQEWTKLGDVQPCPRCGGDAVWVRDSHDPPTYLALDLQCLSGCPHGSGLTVDNLTVAGVWGDEFSRVSDMMDSLGVDERMHLSDEPVPPSSRKEGSDE